MKNHTFLVFALSGICSFAAHDYSLEEKLAIIETGKPVKQTDTLVIRFRRLLEQLDEAYDENKLEIADTVVYTQKLLREESGIEVRLLDLMEGMNQVSHTSFENLRLADCMTIYIQCRDRGMQHKETINGLHELISALLAASDFESEPQQKKKTESSDYTQDLVEARGTTIDSRKLSKGDAYIVSSPVPVWIAYGSDKRANFEEIPKGGAFKIATFSGTASSPWYGVYVIDAFGDKLGKGWINSKDLQGQPLEPYSK